MIEHFFQKIYNYSNLSRILERAVNEGKKNILTISENFLNVQFLKIKKITRQ